MMNRRSPSTVTISIHAVITLWLNFRSASCCSFTITNNCRETIWPATMAGAGTPQLPVTGLCLDPRETVQITAPLGWSGRIWARTGCTFDEHGIGSCQTGDCDGRLECDGIGAQPPVTLFEITLGSWKSKDFYDVSIVDGYNLPIIAVPRGVDGSHCNPTGCVADLNSGCPRELQLEREGGEVVACKSACEAFGLDQYCCKGDFADPNSCRPSFYSSIFKSACPRAYSYAFDDGTSTFTCNAGEYDIIFCPNVNRLKESNETSPGDNIEGDKNEGDLEEINYSAKSMTFNFYYILPILILCLIIG